MDCCGTVAQKKSGIGRRTSRSLSRSHGNGPNQRIQHAGVEFIHILEGVVEYGYGAKRYRLHTGDTMQLHGEVAHGPTELVELPIRFLSIKVHPLPDS